MRQSDYSNILTQTAASWFLAGGVLTSECVAAYQPKGALSLAASYVNLNNPGTNDAAPGTAPTWDVTNGWKFALASSQYLTTGIIPASGYSMIARFSNKTTVGTRWPAGVDSNSSAKFYFSPYWNGDQALYGSGNLVFAASGYTSGVIAVCGQQGYKNGIAHGSAIGAWTTTQSNPIFIGALDQSNGTPGLFDDVYIQAFVVYNITLSSTQVGLISAAMAAL